jgi:hypothetical protein
MLVVKPDFIGEDWLYPTDAKPDGIWRVKPKKVWTDREGNTYLQFFSSYTEPITASGVPTGTASVLMRMDRKGEILEFTANYGPEEGDYPEKIDPNAKYRILRELLHLPPQAVARNGRGRLPLAPAPFLRADGGRLPAGAPPASPRDHQAVPGGGREEQSRPDLHPDPRDVQPIGVQTRVHRHVRLASGPPRMAVACLEQKSEARIVEIDPAAPTAREGGRAWAMLGIRAVGRPAGIVEYREQLHHSGVGTRKLRELPPILQHPAPVGDAVDAVREKPVLLENHPKEPLSGAASFESLFRCHDSMGYRIRE